VGAENLNPLDELKNLDQQVDGINDLNALKPIFYRLDEIARQHEDDFEVQLVVGDIKQHLVNRGTKLKAQAAETIPLEPRAATPPPMAAPPPIVTPPPIATAKPAPPATPPPTPRAPVIPNPKVAPTQVVTPGPGPSSTGQQAAAFAAHPPAMPAGPPPHIPPQGPPTMHSVPPQQPPPKGPTNWSRPLLLGAVIGAIVSIILLAVVVNAARKHNAAEKQKELAAAGVQVDMATTPPNASIRVNGEQKCNSPCQVSLAPGSYQVMAFLDGYEAATSTLNVTAGQPANVNLTLAPQTQSVRILTDLDAGTVTVDDQPPAELQDGQFVIDNVTPGQHTIKVTGKTGEASFSFETAVAKPPVVSGAITAKNLVAVLVSSLGSQARVVTNNGPMKLTVNGQQETDAGPAGVDLRGFQPGVDEIIVGEGKDERTMKENFGPSPMLTAFLKSDLNIGTLIVSTGEDDVHVFVNNKEWRRKTQKGQVRIQTIGNVTVRVAKDGFQQEPPQTAEVKKGAETRLEFKLKALPQLSTLQIQGATPGAQVFIDQSSVGTVGPDGSFSIATVSPGDHTVELRKDQFTPKRVKLSFKAGAPVSLSGADVVLASAGPGTGTIHVTRNPVDLAVTYRRADESQLHELKGDQIDLPPGSYIVFAKAPGYTDRVERVQVNAGETRNLQITMAKAVTVPVLKPGDITGFADPSSWKEEDGLWLHKGGGFVPYKLGPKGVYTFTVELVKGGGVFRGGRIRWAVEYTDSKNYLLYELDHKTFWAEVVQNGKKLERAKTQHGLENQKAFSIQVEITPEHCVHRIKNLEGQWVVLDSFAEPGRNFTDGPFGFLIQGNDEIGVSSFSFQPK
jgi:hypothetical protein